MIIRVLLVALGFLAPSLAFAQSAVSPNVVNGATSTGAPIYAPVGNGAANSVPLPTRNTGAPTLTPIPGSTQVNVNVSVPTSLTVPTGATLVAVVCSAAVNWRDDGTPPTSSAGMALQTNVLFTYPGNLAAIQFIAQTSATCNFAYYK